MTTKHLRTVALLAMFPFIQGIQSACAQLSMLEQPWLGYFAVAESREFQFLMSQNGSFEIMILTKDGGQIPLPVTLYFLATETLPDGSTRDLIMNLDTLESADEPTAKLRKTVFRCKLTEQASGQPTIEGTIEIAGGTILVNARITDKGAFNQNPLRPVIRAGFPAFYAAENSQKEQWDKKQTRDFERQIGRDAITLKHLDGKRVKLECVAVTDAKSKEVNGVGSTSAEVDISAYQKRRIEFLAAPHSSLILGNAGPAPLHHGFWLEWSTDAAKDPGGMAKLAISIK